MNKFCICVCKNKIKLAFLLLCSCSLVEILFMVDFQACQDLAVVKSGTVGSVTRNSTHLRRPCVLILGVPGTGVRGTSVGSWNLRLDFSESSKIHTFSLRASLLFGYFGKRGV